MLNNPDLPKCRNCPLRAFELAYVHQANFGATRYMGICHALEVVLQPLFPEEKIQESLVISKANMQTVQFEPVDNCPCIEEMRDKGLLPFESYSIDFTKRKWGRKEADI